MITFDGGTYCSNIMLTQTLKINCDSEGPKLKDDAETFSIEEE